MNNLRFRALAAVVGVVVLGSTGAVAGAAATPVARQASAPVTGTTTTATAGTATTTAATLATTAATTSIATDGGPIVPNGPQRVLHVPASTTVDWTFDADAGQFLRLAVGQFTSSSFCAVDTTFLDADERVLFSSSCTRAGSQLDRATAVVSGTHRLRLGNTSDEDLDIPIVLSTGSDLLTTVVPDGSSRTSVVGVPGQQVVMSFVAQRGQTVTLDVVRNTLQAPDNGFFTVELVDRFGAVQARRYALVGSSSSLAVTRLPAGGRWTIRIDPGGRVGRIVTALTVVTPLVTPLVPDVSTTVPPINGDDHYVLAFKARAGQNAVLSFEPHTFATGYASLFSPSGDLAHTDVVDQQGVLDLSGELRVSGTYQLWVQPSFRRVDGGDVVLHLSPGTVAAGSIPVGSPTTVGVGRVGSTKTYGFPGATGSRPVLSVAATSWTRSSAPTEPGRVLGVVRRPDGSSFAAFDLSDVKALQELPLLDATGEWTITVDPGADSTGSARITLTLVSDLTVDAVPGTPLEIRTTEPGQNVVVRFAGQKGQRPTLTTADASWLSPTDDTQTYDSLAYLTGPGGLLTSEHILMPGTGDAFGDLPPLVTSGTWSLTIDPPLDATGSATLTLGLLRDTTTTAKLGEPIEVLAGEPGAVTTFHVPARYGQRLTAVVTSSHWASSLGPVGTPALGVMLRHELYGGLTFGEETSGFAESGPARRSGEPWEVTLDPEGDVRGSMTIVFAAVPDQQRSLALGKDTAVAVKVPGQQVRLRFAGGSGQQLPWSLGSATFAGTLTFVTPDGSSTTPVAITPGQAAGAVTLSQTGTWTVVVDAAGAATGTGRLRVG